MKKEILSALLIGTIASCSFSMLDAMKQDQHKPPQQLGTLLKNGSRSDMWTIFCTHLNVISVLHENGLAVLELVNNCRDNKSPISKKSGNLLHQYLLVDKTHKPYPELVDVIISMAEGEGINMVIGGATKGEKVQKNQSE